MVVHPRSSERKRHENGLNSSRGGLQTKGGTSIVDKVELHVSASSQLLPLLLLGSVGQVLSSLDDGHVRGQEGSQRRSDEAEKLFGILILEIVKEDTANTSTLLSVLDDKVLVAPLLELSVVVLVVLVAGLLESLVEVHGVLLEEVGGGQVRAAAKPPRLGGAVGVHGLKVPVVEVHGGSEGVDGMQHHGQAAGVKGQVAVTRGPDAFVVDSHLLHSHGGQQAVHDTDVDAGLFKHLAVLENARNASSALALQASLPLVHSECGRLVERLQLGHNLLLHALDEVLHSQLDGTLIVAEIVLVELGESRNGTGLDGVVADGRSGLELTNYLAQIIEFGRVALDHGVGKRKQRSRGGANGKHAGLLRERGTHGCGAGSEFLRESKHFWGS